MSKRIKHCTYSLYFSIFIISVVDNEEVTTIEHYIPKIEFPTKANVGMS